MTSKNRRRSGAVSLRNVFIVGVLIAMITAFAMYNRAMRNDETIISKLEVKAWPVDARTVSRGDAEDTFLATGTLRAEQESTISAEVAARVVKVEKDLGDPVKKGQAILRLDAQAYALSRKQAKAQADSAEAARDQAVKDFQRAEKLLAKDLISSSEFEQLRLAKQTAVGSYQAAKAQASQASRNLAEAVIRAPFAGHISKRHVEVGTLVSPGQPVVTVVQKAQLKMNLGLSEHRIAKVTQGSKVKVRVPALDHRDFEGHVSRIGVAADSATGAFPVEVIVPATDPKLMPGMSAKASIQLAAYDSVISLPSDVVLTDEKGDYVFAVVDGKGVKKPVKLGPTVGSDVIIEQGISEGDRVVVIGHRNLTDGVDISLVHLDGKRIEIKKTPEPDSAESEG
jgi:membrane fusion protein, multidrug efflux system